MSWTVRIEHPDDTTTEYDLVAAEIDGDIGKTDVARVDLWGDASPDPETALTRDRDTVIIEDPTGTDIWGGLLGDVDGRDTVIELVVDGPEAFAKRAEPTGASHVRSDIADSTVVTNALDRVPELSAGTVNTVTDAIRVSYQHASPAEQIRDLEEFVDAVVRFNTDFTVDYAAPDTLARSRSTTLSPSNGNLAYDSVERRGTSDGEHTHYRALGSGRGALQAQVNLVPDGDTREYTNKITYSSTWSEGDTEDWHVATNRSLDGGQALRDYARELRRQTENTTLVVSGTVYLDDVQLFDRFTVDIPAKDVSSETLEVRSLSERIDADGHYYEVELTSRNAERSQSSEGETRESVSQFARRDRSLHDARTLDAVSIILGRRGN